MPPAQVVTVKDVLVPLSSRQRSGVGVSAIRQQLSIDIPSDLSGRHRCLAVLYVNDDYSC